MGRIYFTSDWHFGHDREFIWGARGYANVDEMNTEQIRKYNEIITDEDDVYVLGDLVLGDIDKGIECLKQLKGKIHVCLGNHDTSRREKIYRDLGYEVCLADRLKYKKLNFYMSHFPTITDNGDADSPYQVTWNLHGHTHSTQEWSLYPHCFNVNIDAHDGYPVLLDDIIEKLFSHFGQ